MKKILWIEDDVDFISPINIFLKNEGWEVKTANSLEDGEKLAEYFVPDLIIMDIILGKESGFSGIEDFKENPRFANIPIIIFSSLTKRWGETTATREDGLLSKAEEFIDKSQGHKVLIETIKKYL